MLEFDEKAVDPGFTKRSFECLSSIAILFYFSKKAIRNSSTNFISRFFKRCKKTFTDKQLKMTGVVMNLSMLIQMPGKMNDYKRLQIVGFQNKTDDKVGSCNKNKKHEMNVG